VWPLACDEHNAEFFVLLNEKHHSVSNFKNNWLIWTTGQCGLGCRMPKPEHPLDPMGLTWQPRVEMMRAMCCVCVSMLEMRLEKDGIAEWSAHRDACDHDGINWVTVGMILDWLMGQGVGDQGFAYVHTWPEPPGFGRAWETRDLPMRIPGQSLRDLARSWPSSRLSTEMTTE
jgi:hypothetical protein